jgi:hypothetical protein
MEEHIGRFPLSALGRYGKHLAERGWPIIPIKPSSKKPALETWQKRHRPPTPDELSYWRRRFGEACGIGFVCHGLVGIDIDCLDEELANKVRDLAIDILGESRFERVGRKPKTLLLYRTDDSIESGQLGEKDALVEVFARTSTGAKQFVAYGVHPVTNQPYAWIDEDNQPLNCTPAQLPRVSQAQVNQFLDEAARLFMTLGLKVGKRRTAAQTPSTPSAGGCCSFEDGVALFAGLENNFDWFGWWHLLAASITVGMPYEAFADFSRRNPNHNEEVTIRHWNHLTKTSRREVGIGTIIYHRREQGLVTDPALIKRVIGEAPAPKIYPAQVNLPQVQRLPVEDIQRRMRSALTSFDGLVAEVESNRGRTPTLSDQIEAAKGRPIATRARLVMTVEAGAGKSYALAEYLENRRVEGAVCYVTQNGNTANQVSRELRARLGAQRVRILRGCAKTCIADGRTEDGGAKRPDYRAEIETRAKLGLSSRDICDECAYRTVCPYWEQMRPAEAGEVIVVQQQHVLQDILHPFNQAGSARIGLTIIDEDIVRSAIHRSSVDLKLLKLEIILPDIPIPEGCEDVGSLDDTRLPKDYRTRVVERQILAHNANRAIRLVRECLDSYEVKQAHGDPLTQAVASELLAKPGELFPLPTGPFEFAPYIEVEGKLIPLNSADTTAEWLAAQVDKCIRIVLRQIMEEVRINRKSGKAVDFRTSAGQALRTLRNVSVVLKAIAAGHNHPDGIIPGVILQGCGDERVLHAAYLAGLPAQVTEAPIIYSDATGDPALVAALLRERPDAPIRLEPGTVLAIRGDVHRPVYHHCTGEAVRPFGDFIYVNSAPITSTQLVKPLRDAEKAESTALKSLADLRADANPVVMERYVRWVMLSTLAEIAKQRGCAAHELKAGVIGPKEWITALRMQPWVAELGLLLGHHGAVAGLNNMEDVDLLVIIGALRPDWLTVRLAAGAIAAVTGERLGVTGVQPYEVAPDVPLLVGGQTMLVTAFQGLSWVTDRAYHLLSRSQSIQSVGRARANQRKGPANSVVVVVIDGQGTGEYDSACDYQEVSKLDLFVTRYGRLPTSPVEAAELAPDLWTDRKHAQRDLSILGVCASAMSSYRGPRAPLPLSSKGIVADAQTQGASAPTYSIEQLMSGPLSNDPRSVFNRITWRYYGLVITGSYAESARWLSEATGEKVLPDAVRRWRMSHEQYMTKCEVACAELIQEMAQEDGDATLAKASWEYHEN